VGCSAARSIESPVVRRYRQQDAELLIRVAHFGRKAQVNRQKMA
jgi:hypothetical protein